MDNNQIKRGSSPLSLRRDYGKEEEPEQTEGDDSLKELHIIEDLETLYRKAIRLAIRREKEKC